MLIFGVTSKTTRSQISSSAFLSTAFASFPSLPTKNSFVTTSKVGKAPVERNREVSGVLEIEVRPAGEMSEIAKVAFWAG